MSRYMLGILGLLGLMKWRGATTVGLLLPVMPGLLVRSIKWQYRR